MTIIKTYLGMKAIIDRALTDDQREDLQWLLAVYGFVLPEYKQTYTAWEWCEWIRKTYDINNPRNAAAINMIMAMA